MQQACIDNKHALTNTPKEPDFNHMGCLCLSTGFPKPTLGWDPFLTAQLRDNLAALGPALTSVTSLHVTTKLHISRAMCKTLVAVHSLIGCVWGFIRLYILSRTTWDFDALCRPSPKYMQLLLKACPRVTHLSVEGSLLWSLDNLRLLGSFCPHLTCLQVIEQELGSGGMCPFHSAEPTPVHTGVFFEPLLHGRSSVLTALPGGPIVKQVVADILASPVTERGSPGRTHAIMCHSKADLCRLFKDGVVTSRLVEGWEEMLPHRLQVLSFAVPIQMMSLNLDFPGSIDITCWLFNGIRGNVTEMRLLQLMCVRAEDSKGWLCAGHPCQHVYDYPRLPDMSVNTHM